MFQSLRKFIYDRRRGIATAVGIAGGIYLVGRYVLERLEEMREEALQTKKKRDNLRRRFQQNQQDISYTIMTLLPTLGDQILNQMDVESLTQELQLKSRTAKRRSSPDTAASESSLASSVEYLHGVETSSDVISLSGTSTISTEFDVSANSQGPALHLPSEAPVEHGSPYSNANAYLSDSITSESVISTSDGERPFIRRTGNDRLVSPAFKSKSKNELWKEIKFITFTRTLTIIYATTLLSLLTHIQLNLLGRYKYIQSVLQMKREESARDRRALDTSASSWFWGATNNNFLKEEDANDVKTIDETTEAKFLSVSWWLLHVGWKDVAERVRRSVEDVFESVSLKARIDSSDLHRLLYEVRRKVEKESTYEGSERKTDFISSLIPPTTETLQHVLVEAGMSPDLASTPDPMFKSLLEEVRWIATSESFTRTLGICVDKGMNILFDDLQNTVFTDGIPSDGDRDAKIRLASMLPGLARWSHTALNGLPNDLVDGMAEVREVEGFAAMIYATYENVKNWEA